MGFPLAGIIFYLMMASKIVKLGKQKKHKADQLKPLEKHYDRPDDQPLQRDIGDHTKSYVFNHDSGNIEHSQNKNDHSPDTRAKGMDA